MAAKTKEKEVVDVKNNDTVGKTAGSVLILLSAQFAIVLVAASLFLASFLFSPLQPILWMQIVAVVVVLLGGFSVILWILWRHLPITSVIARLAQKIKGVKKRTG